MRSVIVLGLAIGLAAVIGCDNGGSGSSTTGGGSGTSSGSSSGSSSSSSGGTTGGGGDGGWQCQIVSDGTCACSNAPNAPGGLSNCSSGNGTCCATCDDVGDPNQFCACETIDPTQGMCITGDTICGSNTLLYSNAQLTNGCPG